MKKIAIILVVLTMIFVSCKEEEIISPGSPSGLVLTATGGGTQVKLEWESPTGTSPDGYIIYFKSIGSVSYTVLDTTVDTYYVHDPNGETGDYYVTAYSDAGGESGPSEVQSTIPVHTDPITVHDLNHSGNSGYGWARASGTGASYPMSQSSSIPEVDFYITDWEAGWDGDANGNYYIASPDMVSQDASNTGFVPQGNWRVNGILSISISEANSILPPSGDYANYETVVGNSYYGVHTEDDYYGVVFVSGVPNSLDGYVQVETWFQLIPGLRLIKHSTD